MDKCWFILRQNHYPPPVQPSSPQESAKGAICLGHVIPSLKHLDQVINNNGPLPYPAGMPPYLTAKWNLSWDCRTGHNVDVNAKAEVPTGVLPVDVRGDAGLVFKRTVRNYSQFERLDTLIIQPTRAYIENTLEDAEITKFLDKKKVLGMNTWTLFMISGIVIAKGGRGARSETRSSGAHGHVGLSIPITVDVGGGGNISSASDVVEKHEKASDFVWAVRLTRIRKSLLSETWEKETFVKGATFTLGEREEPIKAGEILKGEGFELIQDAKLCEESEDDIFVLQREYNEVDADKKGKSESGNS